MWWQQISDSKVPERGGKKKKEIIPGVSEAWEAEV